LFLGLKILAEGGGEEKGEKREKTAPSLRSPRIILPAAREKGKREKEKKREELAVFRQRRAVELLRVRTGGAGRHDGRKERGGKRKGKERGKKGRRAAFFSARPVRSSQALKWCDDRRHRK